MLTKLEYLKKAISSNIVENKSWYISCFAIPILKDELNWEYKNLNEIVTKTDGLYFIDIDSEGNKQLIKISDYKKDEPLFNFQELIEIDGSWLPTIKSKIQTKIGILIVNRLVFYPAFKLKLEYINNTIKIPDIENMLANKVVSDKIAKPDDITVSEMIICIDNFNFLSNLANLINIAATPKTITPPPNIEQEKKKLLKEYEGQLSDPVKLVELENKLNALDQEYLKDDIAASKIFNKKSKTARKKMYLMFGDSMDFKKTSASNTIISSLQEGVETTEEEFPKYMNDLRLGSYSRGALTQLGGYTYKILQRSLSNLSITPNECDTKIGLKRNIEEYNYSKLINRYIKEDNKWKLIENKDIAKKYIGKLVEIRSSMFCTSPGNTICYKCMNEVYKQFPTGITNIASELSGILLSLFMKLMHSTQTESTVINIDDLST